MAEPRTALDGYQQQVAPATGDLPMIDPAPYQELGDAVARFGQTVESGDLRIRRIQQQLDEEKDKIGWASKRAQADAEMDSYFEQAKTQAGPGGAGFTDMVLKKFDEGRADILPENPAARRLAEAQTVQDRAQFAERAMTYVQGQQTLKMHNDAKKTKDTLLNTLYLNPPIEGPHNALTAYDQMIDGSTLLTPEQKDQFKHEFEGEAIESGVRGLIAQGNTQAAAGWLSSDTAKGALAPEKLATLGSALQSEVDRQRRANEHATNLAKTQANEQIGIILKQIGDGIELPDSTLDQASQLASSLGLDSKAYDLGVARIRMNVNHESRNWTPNDFDHAQQTLAAKVADGKASPEEQVQLDQIRKIAPGRIAQFRANPGQWAAGIGNPPPQINLSDPKSVAARGLWAAGVEKASGAWTPLLSQTEAAPLIEAVAHGSPNDRLEAARTIASFGTYAPKVLRQVAAKDQTFQIAVRLSRLPDHGAAARDVLLGPEALKTNPNILDKYGKQDAVATFNSQVSGALSLLPDYAAGVLNAAQNIYASRMARAGQTSWDDDIFKGALTTALGGDGEHGGIGHWGGAAVILPTDMTQAEFDRRISRARPEEFTKAGNGLPIFASGRAVYTGELRGMTPVAVGDGRYQFRSGNSWLMTHGGVRYELDLHRLNPK